MTAAREPVLSAEGITLARGERRILDGISLDVAPGRLLAVIGPNGAGKSSLLSVLSGLWKADAGTVRLAGKDIGAWAAPARARLCAVMRQEPARPAGLSVLEAVELGRLAHGAGAGEAHDIAWEMLRRTGLEDLAARDCTALSGGEWQRVAFARTVAQVWNAGAPAALLLDEPVSSLDPSHQHELLDGARRLARDGHAVMAVLHDLNLTAHYADEVALLHGGRLRARGPASDMMRPELLTEIYGCRVESLEDADRGLHALLSLPG